MARKGSFSTDGPSKKKAPSSQRASTASQARTKHRPPLPWPWALGLLSALLILPIWAALVLSGSVDWRAIASYQGLILGLTLFCYWSDKRKAQRDQWRIPEGTLHLLELLGGWPAAWCAQRILRHKTKKKSYQAFFRFIIGLHQFFAAEVVTGWWISRSLWQVFL